MDDGLLVLGVFGAWPTSLFLWHIRRVRDCGWCIDNSLAVMTTVAIECVLPIVDWGLERHKACRHPRGMDTAHKWSAEVLWMMVS